MSARDAEREWFTVENAMSGAPDGDADTATRLTAVLAVVGARAARFDLEVPTERATPETPSEGTSDQLPDAARAARENLLAARRTPAFRRKANVRLTVTRSDPARWDDAALFAPSSPNALVFGADEKLLAASHGAAVTALLSADEVEALRGALGEGAALTVIPPTPSMWDFMRPRRDGR